jgi:hypothetical protein
MRRMILTPSLLLSALVMLTATPTRAENYAIGHPDMYSNCQVEPVSGGYYNGTFYSGGGMCYLDGELFTFVETDIDPIAPYASFNINVSLYGPNGFQWTYNGLKWELDSPAHSEILARNWDSPDYFSWSMGPSSGTYLPPGRYYYQIDMAYDFPWSGSCPSWYYTPVSGSFIVP